MLKQILEVTRMNLRNLSARRGTSLVIVVGMAGVVAVLVGLLAMSAGFTAALESTGRPDRAVILREGSTQEIDGGISAEAQQIVSQLEGIVRASNEVYVGLDLPSRETGKPATAVGRGVDVAAFEVRPELQIVAGRGLSPGRSEMIAGTAAVQQYTGLEIGDEVELRGSTWTVVGHFEGGGAAYASEIWMDLSLARATFRRAGTVSSIRVQLEHPGAATEVRARLRADPRLELDLTTEVDFYAEQSRARAELIESFAYLVATIMAVGSIVAALNTMYSAVSTRTIEIATLRALGFGGLPIVVSVMIEALLLAMLGSLLGGVLVYLVFDGYATSTLNAEAYSQVAFEFAVTPDLLLLGVSWALVLGLIGGLFPAIRAGRLPIVAALRGA
jgi:putative ABC transport system permease protein